MDACKTFNNKRQQQQQQQQQAQALDCHWATAGSF
jgi:hypothetical protein